MRTESWKNARGESFRVLVWAAPSTATARNLLLLLHGHGEHAGRYAGLAGMLASLPVEIRAYDARGHGESDGARGTATGMDQFVDDLVEILPAQLAESGAATVTIFGHSMGGGVVARYLTARAPHAALRSAILSAPLLRVPTNGIQKVKLAAARAIRRVAPRLSFATGLDAEGISSVPAEVARYREDPLVHERLSAALAVSFFENGAACIADAPKVALPVLAYHGDADPIVDAGGTRDFVLRLGSSDKAFHSLPGVRHEPHHAAPESVAQLQRLLADWIPAHV